MDRARLEWPAVIAIALVAGALLAARVPTGSLMGWDTYPEVSTSRITSVDDLLGTFTEQTAEGFYPFSFYRPVHNLSIAFDHALWDLTPIGYHLSSIALVIATALALFWGTRRLLGAEARWGPWAAMVSYLVLPVQTELIPIVSRRMDTLCGLFMLLAIGIEAKRPARRPRAHAMLAGFATLLAVGSKEAGVVIAPLVFGLVFFAKASGGLGARLREAAIASVPHVAAIAIVFAARFAAIGGLGGHGTTDLSASLTRLPDMLGQTLARITIAWPQLPADIGRLESLSFCAAALASTFAALALTWRRRDVAPGADEAMKAVLVTITMALAAIVMFAGIYAATGQLQVWYLYLPALSLCLFIGGAAQGLDLVRRQSAARARRGAELGLLVIVLWIAAQARHSPIFIGFGHWTRGDAKLTQFLDTLAEQIDAAPRTAYLRVPFPPHFEPVKPSPNATAVVTLINSYSIPAWAMLRFPDRTIEVQLETSDETRPVLKSGVVMLGIDHRKAALRRGGGGASHGTPQRE